MAVLTLGLTLLHLVETLLIQVISVTGMEVESDNKETLWPVLSMLK